MEENKISRTAIMTLQKCLITLMAKNTEKYQSDFVIDMWTMNDLNEAGKLTGKYIFMSRQYGTEFGRPDDPRIVHNWGGENIKYLIDFDKLREIPERDFEAKIHYDDLAYTKCQEYCVVEQVTE